MTAPRTRAATRTVAVLAVLLGLLAMHGLAGTHHAAASATAAQQHPAQAVGDQAAVPVHHHGADEATVPAARGQAAAVLAAPAGPACDENCPDLALLCVAVLTGAALALLMARRRSSPLLVSPVRVRGPAPSPPVRHARGPDPVRELCVSRT